MSRTPVLEPAYILHARHYRNTSLILDLLTRDSGRYSMVVKGARSSTSKLRGRLQPFTPLLEAPVGRGELKTSTAIDFPLKPHRLVGDSLLFGLYINELLYRLLGKFDPVGELYANYEELMECLQNQQNDVNTIRRFELNLLQELGYGINFTYDARNSQPIDVQRHYCSVVQEGFHQTTDRDDDVFPGAELLKLSSGEFPKVDARRLRNLTRNSLGVLLGDKPLKSRTLFQGLAR